MFVDSGTLLLEELGLLAVLDSSAFLKEVFDEPRKEVLENKKGNLFNFILNACKIR